MAYGWPTGWQSLLEAGNHHQIWYQAETGKIPISGGGYGGPFAGEGFDGVWLDMSEIVRPTRDGIHGRECIQRRPAGVYRKIEATKLAVLI